MKDLDNKIKETVSVIIAIRNEEHYIRKCLDSLINQNFPHERYEIIIVDGMSDDKTIEIVNEYKAKFPDLIKLYPNHQKYQAQGRNIGIKYAIGDIVVIFSGHAYAQRDYVMTLVKKLKDAPQDVVGIGGVHYAPDDETSFGKIMADVQNSIVGGAGTSYRQVTKDAYTDTVAFVAYKRKIIEEVGLYDERFAIGEDVELNWRLLKKGYKLMISPEAVSYYYRRHGSLKSLFSRMYKYGLWRALVNKNHPSSFKILFSLPVILVLSLISLPFFAFFFQPLAETIVVMLTIYFFTISGFSLYHVMKHRNVKSLISIPILLIEHFSIGLGFLIGLFKKMPEK